MSETTAKKTFSADDSAVLAALQRMERGYLRMQDAVEKLARSSKASSRAEVQNWKEVEQAIDAAIRKQQELKRQRGELIVSTNFTRTTRDGGALIPAPNFTRPPPPPPRPPGGMIVAPGGGEMGFPGGLPTVQISAIDRAFHAGVRALSSGMGTILRDTGQLVLGFGSLATVMQAVSAALDEQRRHQQNALAAAESVAAGQAEIIINTFGRSEAEQQQLFDATERITKATGMRPGLVAKALGRQVGRGQDLPLGDVERATMIAGELSRHTPEQFLPMASGIQQIMRIGKTDEKTAAALFQSMAAASYPGEPELQSRMIQQSIASGIANIPNPDLKTVEQIGELAAAASQLGGEERGEAVRTAVVSLLSQLYGEFAKGEGPWAISAPGGFKFHPQVKGIPSHPQEAFKWLESQPGLAKRFWDNATFERQYEGIIRSMIREPDSAPGKLLAGVQDFVKPDVAALERQRKQITDRTPQLQLKTQREQATATGELAQSQMTMDGLLAKINQDIEKAAELTSPYANIIRRSEDYLMRGVQEGIGQIYRPDLARRRLINLESLRDRAGGPEGSEGRMVWDTINELLETNKKQLEELRGINRFTPGAGPAMNAQRGVQSER